MPPGNQCYGVFLNSDDNVDLNEVESDFEQFGKIVFVRKIGTRVYVNFKLKIDAEKCLESDYHKYGKIKRAKFADDPPKETKNNYEEFKSYNGRQKDQRKVGNLMVSSGGNRDSSVTHRKIYNEAGECRNGSVKSDEESFGAKPKLMNSRKYENGVSVHSSRDSSQKRRVDRDFREESTNETHLNGMPPLLSIDNSPPALLSAPEHLSDNSSHHKSQILPTSHRKSFGLLPTSYNDINISEECLSRPTPKSNHRLSSLSLNVHDVPPPLLSASTHTSSNGRCVPEISSLFHGNYIHKYGHYLLIADLPNDVTVNEIEKVLYPHIPEWVSDPELTNVTMKVLFCLASFKTPEEATKVAQKLDEVELRGHSLTMIRLDNLMYFNNTPF